MNLDKSFNTMTQAETNTVIQACNNMLKFPIAGVMIIRRSGQFCIQFTHERRKDEMLSFAFDENVRTPRDLLKYMSNLEYVNGQFKSPTTLLREEYELAMRGTFKETESITLSHLEVDPVCREIPFQGFTPLCGHRVCPSCWRKMERCPVCRRDYFGIEDLLEDGW